MFTSKKHGSRLKKKGFIDINLKGLSLYFIIAVVIGLIVAAILATQMRGFLSTLAKTEVIEFAPSVQAFKVKGASKGNGYVSASDGTTRLNAEVLDIYVNGRLQLVGTGASSYLCSNVPLYGCKLRYSFSTGVNDDDWSIFIDASRAISTMDVKEKTNFEIEIIKAFQDAGYNTVVNHAATTVSAVSTAVTSSNANSGDGVFEIGGLY